MTIQPSRTVSHVPSKSRSNSKFNAKPKSNSRPQSTLISGAHIITMDPSRRIGVLDVRIEQGRITEIAPKLRRRSGDTAMDARGLIAMPGLVQTHIHLCQTLFRGLADDMPLLTWLRKRIWPLEGALGADDLRAAARLGIMELLLGGTTSILDMGTVAHTDVLFEEAAQLGIRYTGGKCLMDRDDNYPAGLKENTRNAIAESIRLCEQWHNTHDARLRYAFSPRFALSCTDEAMRACANEARKRGAWLHTHASENTDEIALVRQRTGYSNIDYLHRVGFTGKDVVLAHGIWLSAKEQRILARTGTHITHCPSSNLKLASGIADVVGLRDRGVDVVIGADGAACSNTLDGFMEMRLTALLHKVRHGAEAIPAYQALQMATRGGALALGLRDVGSLEVGHRADLILLDLNKAHAWPPVDDVVSRVVYSARASDVHTVMVDGRMVVHAGQLCTGKPAQILKNAANAIVGVRKRAGIIK